MNENETVGLMLASPLFGGVDRDELLRLVSLSGTRCYEKGENIIAGPPSLYLVLDGRAVVRRSGDGQAVILNVKQPGEVFGAAQLFGDAGLTDVTAACRCRCLVIPREAVEELLFRDHGFTLNYIAFLSDRIRFLNKKIASFTAGDGEKTLAGYLLSSTCEDGRVDLPSNMSALAQSLNMSRPTLYRAFSSLEKRGVIEKNGAYVRIISVEKLKSI